MTYGISVPTVREALPRAVQLIQQLGVAESSRNGRVLALPWPLAVTYTYPLHRVLLSAVRDANPFFHFAEAMWMLGGRDDVQFLAYFNKRMLEFSDDGETLHGAYGHRWRCMPYLPSGRTDQLEEIVDILRSDRTSRRAVLQMWSAPHDLGNPSRDVPCNTHAYFRIIDHSLHMTVCNRSNDVWWGMMGANAVHFSFLQEYLARRVGALVGPYTQFSANAHLYTSVVSAEKMEALLEEPPRTPVAPVVMMDAYHPEFDRDLQALLGPWAYDDERPWLASSSGFWEPPQCSSVFLRTVAYPILQSWYLRKEGRLEESRAMISRIACWEWRTACEEWCARRDSEKAQSGGAQ